MYFTTTKKENINSVIQLRVGLYLGVYQCRCWRQQTWILILALLEACMILGKIFKPFVSSYLICKMGTIASATQDCESRELIYECLCQWAWWMSQKRNTEERVSCREWRENHGIPLPGEERVLAPITRYSYVLHFFDKNTGIFQTMEKLLQYFRKTYLLVA